ncbi:hypothetical protein Y032_0020g231 [Ancylostoma ceylanicum]|uniref:ALG11 mannosyltransferase N-terminal domain-containing protein n=1 Tax=Ancylostoma ceylanicum TaxID=53326 RepID=A0A016V124_9BILA|nr:hypothetical protein Y032_0020g231 [Ancylostoma ceylanicum]
MDALITCFLGNDAILHLADYNWWFLYFVLTLLGAFLIWLDEYEWGLFRLNGFTKLFDVVSINFSRAFHHHRGACLPTVLFQTCLDEPMLFWILFFTVAFIITIRSRRKQNVVAFFHPYCNAGGGGERVLWCALRTMQHKYPHQQCVIYSGDYDATKEQILLKAKQRFGITIDPRNVRFVFLRLRRLVEADIYPRFTLVAQTLGGLVLGFEALLKLNPSIFIDSMGYSLTLPLFRWIAGSKVAAYVHYPTISCD